MRIVEKINQSKTPKIDKVFFKMAAETTHEENYDIFYFDKEMPPPSPAVTEVMHLHTGSNTDGLEETIATQNMTPPEVRKSKKEKVMILMIY